MKIFITGGTGFIGSTVVDILNKKDEKPYCLIRSGEKWLKNSNFCSVKAGCFTEDSITEILKEADSVIYLAGVTKARKYEDYLQGNYRAFTEFYTQALKYGKKLKWMGYISTMAVNRPNADGSPLDETSPLAPVSSYGKSKARVEEFLADRKDLPMFILRLPGVYGPRDMDFLEYFRMVKRGIIPLVGSGDPKTSLIFSEDVARVLIKAMEVQLEGTYYLSDGRKYSHRQMGEITAKILNKKPIYVRIPGYLAHLFAFINEGVGGAGIINREKIREMTAGDWVCDGSLIRRKLDLEPATEAEDGFSATIEWYKKHGFL